MFFLFFQVFLVYLDREPDDIHSPEKTVGKIDSTYTAYLAGEVSGRYVFQAIMEGVLLVLIIGYTWTWPKHDRMFVET